MKVKKKVERKTTANVKNARIQFLFFRNLINVITPNMALDRNNIKIQIKTETGNIAVATAVMKVIKIASINIKNDKTNNEIAKSSGFGGAYFFFGMPSSFLLLLESASIPISPKIILAKKAMKKTTANTSGRNIEPSNKEAKIAISNQNEILVGMLYFFLFFIHP
jgi:hypothetical protein